MGKMKKGTKNFGRKT